MTLLGRRTLRARVSILTCAAVLVLLLLAAVGLVLALRATLTANLDEALLDRAESSAAAVIRGGSVVTDVAPDDVVVQLLAADGTVLESVPDDAPALLAGSDPPPDGEVRPVALPDGDGHLVTRRVFDRTVVVASSLDDVRESSAALGRALAGGVPLAPAGPAALVGGGGGRPPPPRGA